MPLLPVKATVAPSDLVGQPNGHIDPALLTQLLPGTASLARLHHTVARGWFALAAAALEAGGWVLWWTSVADTYRTYEVQLAVFLARYEPVSSELYFAAPKENRKEWKAAPALGYASAFWIKKNLGTPTNPKYPATAAVPGTSPHGFGCAIDGALKTPTGIVGWTKGSPHLTWLIANARRFGFAWSLQDEPWHIQWVEGDHIPQAVLDYEHPPQPDPGPTPIPSGRIIDMYRITYRLDRWPGAFEATVSADAVTHSLSANRGKIDAEAGVPIVPLDRQGIVDLLSDIGLKHLSYSATQSGGQNPFSATYDNGNYHDTELELLWARRQSAE